jgi:two-component system, OmpR family, KDP operon response regulator KdpE
MKEQPRDKGVVLLVEDEAAMRRFLRVTLGAHGFRLIEAVTGREGLALAAGARPEVMLLDLGLPDMDGLAVIRRLREWSSLPVIVLSAREQEGDKIEALDAGADDYLTKPFGAGELIARIRVALRHAVSLQEGEAGPVITAGDLQVDLAARTVTRKGEEVHLTPLEYRLFTLLLRHPGKVLTHRQLLTEVWGAAYASQTQYLRVYMTQLRHKLEDDPARPRFFQNEPGVGYRFRLDPLAPAAPPRR